MEPTRLCLIWRKVIENPKDREIKKLTESQKQELGLHVNSCELCQDLTDQQTDAQVSPFLRRFPILLRFGIGVPLWVKILLNLDIEERLTPEEQRFIESAQAERENERREIEQTVRAFLLTYPQLAPQNFSLSNRVCLRAFWAAQHFLMMLARRYCYHQLGGAVLETVGFGNDGSMVINGHFTIPPDTLSAEVYRTAQETAPGTNRKTAAKLVRWLAAAARLHPLLLDPATNQPDPSDQKDFLAAWRIS